MLKRFLHFGPEITELLKFVKTQSMAKTERESFNLEVSRIDEAIWTYLSFICNIVKSFVEPTMESQRFKIATSSMTLTYMGGILNDIDAWRAQDLVVSNPLVAFGLDETSKKILQYCPVHDNDI